MSLKILVLYHGEGKWKALTSLMDRIEAPEYLKTRYKKLLMEYQKVWKTKEKNKAFSALVSQLLNCEDIFRMFEDKLPPVVKKKADINKEYRQKCDEWCDLVYDNLDIYADFVDKKTKDTAFISILLHKIATEKKNTRYKLVLYCVG